MKARYTAIYRLGGYTQLPAGTHQSKMLDLQAGPVAVTATVTADPEPFFTHIDESWAMIYTLPRAKFNVRDEAFTQKSLATEIEALRAARANGKGAGVFVAFEGAMEIPPIEFKHRHDLSDFGVCVDDVDKNAIRERFRPWITCVMTALSLGLRENADHRLEKIADAVYLIDPANGKPIYTVEFKGGEVGLFVAGAMAQADIEAAGNWAANLAADKTMSRPSSLLVTSLNKATGELQNFIAAWTALEIFVTATFKAEYEARWFNVMEDGAPEAATPVFERFKQVMSDKYRLADKFLIIASVLQPATAADDAKEFSTLKKLRDDLFHGNDVPTSSQHTSAIQKLLLKYMRLHLVA